MNNIEEIVSLYNIKEKRELMNNNRKEITHLKKLMSDLKINRNVAIYASCMQEILSGDEIYNYLSFMESLKDDPDVQEYIKLYRQVCMLEEQIVNYYRSIQIGLRNRLSYDKTPDIYVYYGTYNDKIFARNIIGPELTFLNDDNTFIFPDKEMKSRRKARHFYNRTSFKYLEELSKDDSLSLEGKNLGKVKVLKREGE